MKVQATLWIYCQIMCRILGEAVGVAKGDYGASRAPTRWTEVLFVVRGVPRGVPLRATMSFRPVAAGVLRPRVLITGGAGFIGPRIVEPLLHSGHKDAHPR